jgi:hypothetical protein
VQVIRDRDALRPHRVGCGQQVRHHDRHRAGRMRRRDAVMGVLEREAIGRRHAKLCGGRQERIRRGLRILHVLARHDRGEMPEQPDPAEIALDRRPPRRCRDRLRNAFRRQIRDQLARARTKRNLALERGFHHGVVGGVERRHRKTLAVMRLDHRDAFLARHADHREREGLGHHPVDRGRGLEQAIEIEPLGVQQQAVHVEDDARDGPAERHAQPIRPSTGNISSSQKLAVVTNPLRNAMPVSTSAAPMVRSTHGR